LVDLGLKGIILAATLRINCVGGRLGKVKKKKDLLRGYCNKERPFKRLLQQAKGGKPRILLTRVLPRRLHFALPNLILVTIQWGGY